METHLSLVCLGVVALAAVGLALPTTLLEDTKAAGTHLENKVKRSHGEEKLNLNVESNVGLPVTFFNNPSAAKRGLRNDNGDDSDGEWDQRRAEMKPDIPEKVYYPDENPFEDKSLREYEKGFHYGTNKAKLDEQMENAILKSEMYGEPSAINQYRYFGGSDDRRRKRSNAKRSFSRYANRYKRELELSPEEIMTLLSLLEKDKHGQQPFGYRTYWSRDDLDEGRDLNELDEPEDAWLDAAAYPAAKGPLYAPQLDDTLDQQQRLYAGLGERRRKRFMVAKRFDPSRTLRYLAAAPAAAPQPQSRDDLYSLSQLLGGARRDAALPAVRRVVL